MDLWTQWEKDRARQTEKVAPTYTYIYTIMCEIDN